MSAALKGATDVAIGNIIGSNIANVGLVVGLVAVFHEDVDLLLWHLAGLHEREAEPEAEP